MNSKLWVIFLLILSSSVLLFPRNSKAQEMIDTDNDGLFDYEELFLYYTDINNKDTDGDFYLDGEEVKNGFSPLVANKKMDEVDTDGDDLVDSIELALKTDLNGYDSDGDGTSDGEEVYSGSDPLVPGLEKKSVQRKVEVDLTKQQLFYFMNGVKLGSMSVSTGLTKTPTPRGEFRVIRKLPVHHYIGPDYNLPNTKWNLEFKRSYYLHGAYWHNQFGIRPMSHGCVNIAYKDVEKLYKFMDVGDKVVIYGQTPYGKVKKS